MCSCIFRQGLAPSLFASALACSTILWRGGSGSSTTAHRSFPQPFLEAQSRICRGICGRSGGRPKGRRYWFGRIPTRCSQTTDLWFICLQGRYVAAVPLALRQYHSLARRPGLRRTSGLEEFYAHTTCRKLDSIEVTQLGSEHGGIPMSVAAALPASRARLQPSLSRLPCF